MNKELPTFRLKSLLFLTLVLLLPVLASAATVDVQVLDPRSFSPSEMTIQVGDTVRWTNASGGNMHDVTADDFSFNSPTASSFVYTRQFNTPGDILYHCTVHSRPASAGGTAQNGVIHVLGTSASTDVSVDSVDASDGSFQAGADFKVKVALKNNGSSDSGMFNVNFYASTDAAVSDTDRLLGTVAMANIAAGASMNLDESVSLPTDLDPADYYIGAIIDLDDTDASNNSNADATAIFVFVDFLLNTGLNDAWFNPATDGQGFFITVLPKLNFLLIAWFTYDTELPPASAMANLGDPGNRWMTAVGDINGNMSVATVEFASGGLFDTPPAAGDIKRVEDGTLTVEFSNCNAGTISYNIPSLGLMGVVPIERVAIDNAALCSSLLREMTLNPQ